MTIILTIFISDLSYFEKMSSNNIHQYISEYFLRSLKYSLNRLNRLLMQFYSAANITTAVVYKNRA